MKPDLPRRAFTVTLSADEKPSIGDRWRDVCARVASDGFNSLAAEEKTWIRVRDLIDSIRNGGLISYFYNYGADRYDDCMQDLRVLRADEVIRAVEGVACLFGNTVPSNIDERNAIINTYPVDLATSMERKLEDIDRSLLRSLPALEADLAAYMKAWWQTGSE